MKKIGKVGNQELYWFPHNSVSGEVYLLPNRVEPDSQIYAPEGSVRVLSLHRGTWKYAGPKNLRKKILKKIKKFQKKGGEFQSEFAFNADGTLMNRPEIRCTYSYTCDTSQVYDEVEKTLQSDVPDTDWSKMKRHPC